MDKVIFVVFGVLAILLAIGTFIYGLMPSVEPKWPMAMAFVPFLGGVALIEIGLSLPKST